MACSHAEGGWQPRWARAHSMLLRPVTATEAGAAGGGCVLRPMPLSRLLLLLGGQVVVVVAVVVDAVAAGLGSRGGPGGGLVGAPLRPPDGPWGPGAAHASLPEAQPAPGPCQPIWTAALSCSADALQKARHHALMGRTPSLARPQMSIDSCCTVKDGSRGCALAMTCMRAGARGVSACMVQHLAL